MAPRLWFDTETRSKTPIKVGTYGYARDAEVTLVAYALDDGCVQHWEPLRPNTAIPADFLRAWKDPKTEIWAHNAQFDRLVTRTWFLPTPSRDRWRCSMVLAYSNSLPGALDDLCALLKVPQEMAKLKEGRELINLFCIPDKDGKYGDWDTHPEKWAKFVAYCRNDVEAMRYIVNKLPHHNARDVDWRHYELDQRINDRGFQIDAELAEAAVVLCANRKAEINADLQLVTDGKVQTAGQGEAFLKMLLEDYGVTLPDLKADTLRRRMEDESLPWHVRELIGMRQEAAKASVAKYAAALKVAINGRLHGTMQFRGADRTGRDAGRVFQPQNLPRPSVKFKTVKDYIAAIKAGCFDILYDDALRACADSLRSLIVAAPGKKLAVNDWSNIEGRGLAWLAHEDWKLAAFRAFDEGRGPDMYVASYARMFRVSLDEAAKHRQVGKVLELSMGYAGGVKAFVSMAAVYGLNLDELAARVELPGHVLAAAKKTWQWAVENKKTYGLPEATYVACDGLKRMWREAHPETVKFWYALDEAVRGAISSPKEVFTCNYLKIVRAGWKLYITLPSGRRLVYPLPKWTPADGIVFFGRNPYTKKWGDTKTYHGKLAENVNQAMCADIMWHAVEVAEDQEDVEVVLRVHDELVAEGEGDLLVRLQRAMNTVPAWAPGFPLVSAGFETDRYHKE